MLEGSIGRLSSKLGDQSFLFREPIDEEEEENQQEEINPENIPIFEQNLFQNDEDFQSLAISFFANAIQSIDISQEVIQRIIQIGMESEDPDMIESVVNFMEIAINNASFKPYVEISINFFIGILQNYATSTEPLMNEQKSLLKQVLSAIAKIMKIDYNTISMFLEINIQKICFEFITRCVNETNSVETLKLIRKCFDIVNIIFGFEDHMSNDAFVDLSISFFVDLISMLTETNIESPLSIFIMNSVRYFVQFCPENKLLIINSDARFVALLTSMLQFSDKYQITALYVICAITGASDDFSTYYKELVLNIVQQVSSKSIVNSQIKFLLLVILKNFAACNDPEFVESFVQDFINPQTSISSFISNIMVNESYKFRMHAILFYCYLIGTGNSSILDFICCINDPVNIVDEIITMTQNDDQSIRVNCLNSILFLIQYLEKHDAEQMREFLIRIEESDIDSVIDRILDDFGEEKFNEILTIAQAVRDKIDEKGI